MNEKKNLTAGISTASLYPKELEKAFRIICEAGVLNTEIFVNTDCELRGAVFDEMMSIKRQNGTNVRAIHPFTCGIETIMLYSEYSRRLPDFFDYYRQYFEYAQKFEAEFFILHGAKMPMKISRKENFERYLQLSEIAKPYGVTVLQENVERCESRHLDFLKEMKDNLGDNANFVLDTKQALRSGEDPTNVVKSLGKNIRHIHFSDSGKKGDCLFYKDGEYDNEGLFFALLETGNKITLMIETYRDFDDPLYENKLTENYFLVKNDLDNFCDTL
ncbi:MAG: sugar phosphate isomerase/epimerase [Ruminococcus sp.]|jgi:sugar phosphate isomerase/epimerase|nr:sugar phosphate isomerase/epimerase [Ruminococcus sp.]